MKRKGMLCAILALVLLFSAQPVAAASANDGCTTTIVADCRLPVISVTVPSSASVYINPFQLPVTIGETESTSQIISTPASIANMSEVPLEVDVTVAGEVNDGSNMTLASTPTGGTGTSKNAFVYFEIQQADSADITSVEWDPVYDASKHIAIVNDTPVTQQSILTLPARTLAGEVAAGGYAPFRLTGDAVKSPTDPWNSMDGIIVTVAFTFTPLPYES